MRLPLPYPAAVPVGHTVEVTEYSKKRMPPSILDLDDGVRYVADDHVPGTRLTVQLQRVNDYALEPVDGLPIARRFRAVVVATTLVWVDALPAQQTLLELQEIADAPERFTRS